MGLDIAFYCVNKKLSQEELIKVANTTGIGENFKLKWFSGRGYEYILDTLRDDLKSRYGQDCFDDFVRLEREDVMKLVLENIHNIINDKHHSYLPVCSLLMWVLEEVDFNEQTFIIDVSS